MEKIKRFAKEHSKQIIEIGAIILCLIILAIIFYSYPVNLTWDSTEYVGLASYIGTEKMQTSWIGHRGIGFPLLIKLSEIFGKNANGMLTLMFAFYAVMVLTFVFIYRKLYKLGYLKNIFLALLFAGYIFVTIVLNPELFGYYHTILTEFVAISLTILMCFLTWIWKDYTWKNNKKSIIISAIVFAFIVILLYHVKQSLVVFALIPLLVATLISVFNDFSYSNIVYKIATYVFIGALLLISIKSWGNYMTLSKFNMIQILKYSFVFLVIIGLFALISYFGIKVTKKYKLEKKVSNILKYGTLIIVFAIFIFGYNYYKYDEPKVFLSDLSQEEKEFYNEQYQAELEKIKKYAQKSEENEMEEVIQTEAEIQGIDVIKMTATARVDNLILRSVLEYPTTGYYWFKDGFDTNCGSPIDRAYISYDDNIKIDKMLYNLDTDKDFYAYDLENGEKYFIYYFKKDENTFFSQLNGYLELLSNYPKKVFTSYRDSYWKMVYVREGEFSPFDRENYNIPSKIYLTGIRNVVDSNPEYELSAKDYIYDIKENFVNKSLNWYMNKAIFVLLYKTETALWYMPIALSVVVALYLILRIFFNKKIKQEKFKLLEFIIILLATSFGGMMSYIMFDASIERYAVPGIIPVLTAYFLIGLFLLDLFANFIKSTHKKLKQKLYN